MSNPSRSKGKVNISEVWLVVTVSVEGIRSSEQLCAGIPCACLVTQIQDMASCFSLLHKHGLFNSSPSWPAKHWDYPQGARGETGNEVRCRGWKVQKQPGARAISSLWESEGCDLSWCLLFRNAFVMHLSRELQQGLSFVWRWFNCVFCQPWEKISTLEPGEHWVSSLFLGIFQVYGAWGMGVCCL